MQVKSGWIKPNGMCPNCLHDVKPIAIQNEAGWDLRERCNCRHIDNVIPYPFKEGGALEVTANDFSRIGFDIEIDSRYDELLNDQDEDYLNEVDNGWDWSHTG